MYNGFDWYGRVLEVREDRYAGLSGPFRGGLRGGLRGGGRGGLRGGLRGGFRGGFAGAAGGGAGRDFSSQDLYADYSGPDQAGAAIGTYPQGQYAAGAYGAGFDAEPSQQIMVRNVRHRYVTFDHPAVTHIAW